MNTDEWKKIDDYSRYRIYTDGRVYSEIRNRFMKPAVNTRGYLICNFTNDTTKKKKTMTIHRLVARLHIPNPDNKEQVDHIDRDTRNNNVANLRWVSNGENGINRNVYGTIPYRHISYQKTRNRFRIQIKRNNKYIFTKSMTASKYTLDDAVNVRNEKYKILGMDIDD